MRNASSLACIAIATVVTTATVGARAATAETERMTARLATAGGEDVGTVSFERTPSGLTRVVVDVAGLPAGTRAMHVHETGVCDPATGFSSAGGHYAAGMAHGVGSEGGPHPGDFPNLEIPAGGAVKVEFFTDRIDVGANGEHPLADGDGSAVVIHAGADDYVSQPAGNAGDRIACGVIE
jgi:Cu-Zn family superoxide dismutase